MMKLSQLKSKADDLRFQRDALHDELHALLADGSITVGALKAKEPVIRAKIREINGRLFPIDQELAEISRVVKGQPRKQAESWLDYEVTIG